MTWLCSFWVACWYCNQQFDTEEALAAHIGGCPSNPHR